MEKIAIYDLDRTITRIGTFTPFLFFAAWRRPVRLPLLVPYLLAMVGNPLGLVSRNQLKSFGMRLILGREWTADRTAALARAYAAHVRSRNMHQGAMAQIARDRAEGCTIVLASAAPDFYAREIAALLGFDDVIATRQHRLAGGRYSHRIDGPNCYGAEKLRRIEAWLPVARGAAEVRFYSDHHSDRPVFDWADRPVAVMPSGRLRALAESRNWAIMSDEWV